MTVKGIFSHKRNQELFLVTADENEQKFEISLYALIFHPFFLSLIGWVEEIQYNYLIIDL